jgi:hypothetical protein
MNGTPKPVLGVIDGREFLSAAVSLLFESCAVADKIKQ